MNAHQALVKELPLAQIVPTKNNPRRSRSQTGVEELAQSLLLYGVLQPIVVRPLASDTSEAARYEIIAGHRRHQAAQIARLPTIPAIVRQGDGDLAAVMISLAENVQREQLNPIEEAQCYRALMALGMTQARIASYLSKTQGYVATRYVATTLRLLQLPQAVQAQIVAGEVTRTHGRTLLRKQNRGADVEAQAEEAQAQGLTTRQLGGQIAATLAPSDGSPHFPANSAVRSPSDYARIALDALLSISYARIALDALLSISPEGSAELSAKLETAIAAVKACLTVL